MGKQAYAHDFPLLRIRPPHEVCRARLSIQRPDCVNPCQPGFALNRESRERCVPHVSRDGLQEGARGWSILVSKIAGQRTYQGDSPCCRDGLN